MNKNEYIELCKIFGGSYDLVQANGGNISIKYDNKIIIKQSGFSMIHTTDIKGYVICDINLVEKQLYNKDEDLQVCILEGSPNATPSIETFFHLIPKKYIVHLHPIKILHILSLKSWKKCLDELSIENSLYIEYTKPGIELSEKILQKYNNEDIIFLQNHGIILCSDTKEYIYDLINKLNSLINTCMPSTNINFLRELYTYLPNKYIKSYIVQNITNDRYFYKLSPDLSLYLGEYPIIMESIANNIEDEINKYKEKTKSDPKIIINENLIYCISDSSDKLNIIHDMIQTYYNVLNPNPNAIYNEISSADASILMNWDKEKLRMNVSL